MQIKNASQPALLQAKSVFKGVRLPDSLKCIGWIRPDSDASSQEASPYVPRAHDEYVFKADMLQSVIQFLNSPNGDALFLSGPTGSGKTSVINEIAARLGWPVQEITASERLEAQDLIGSFVLSSEKPGEAPSMRFQYGVLPRAMKGGHILIINEWDCASPGELAALNTVLEGGTLTIKETGGEVIHPHPLFRVVVTANTSLNIA